MNRDCGGRVLTIGVLVGLLLPLLGPARATRAEDPPRPISIVALLSTPERFDQKPVQTIGFWLWEFEESALYLSAELGRERVVTNAVWLDLAENSIDPAALAKLKTEAGKRNGIYVLVQGTFDASGRGHQGRSTPGSIVSVVRLDPWPPPLPLPPP